MTRWAALALVFLLARPASAAPTKRECIDANEQAQIHLAAGKLLAARAALRSCAVEACPSTVRGDCQQRLAQLEPRIPSLIVVAADAEGHDLAAVTLRLDGEVLATKLDGRPIDIDPGEHLLVFEAPGLETIRDTLVVREGEKARTVKATMRKPAPPAEPLKAPPPPRGNPRRAAGLVVGGVGVAGLVAGGILGGLAASKWSDSKALCSTDHPDGCKDAQMRSDAIAKHDSASSLATGSTVAIVAGGVLVASGAVLWLTAPRNVGVAPTANGAVLVGSF